MKKLVSIAIVMTMAALIQPASAATASATYVGSFGRLILNQSVQGQPHGIGGYTFDVPTGDPVSIRIQDANGNGVPVLICQEAGVAEPTPGSCEDGVGGQAPGDDIVQKICANGNQQALLGAFSSGANKRLGVFINVDDAVTAGRGPACSGRGTTGTITLTF